MANKIIIPCWILRPSRKIYCVQVKWHFKNCIREANYRFKSKDEALQWIENYKNKNAHWTECLLMGSGADESL